MFVEHARGIEPGAEVRSTTRAEPPRL
jgi:hypothetical protein